MSPKPPDTPNVIAFPPLLYAGPLTIGLFLHAVFPVSFLPQSMAPWLGLLLIGSNLFILTSATLIMRRAGTHINPNQPATELVTHGPFRLSRNPIYLGFTLGYSGVAIWANALWPMLVLPLILAVMQRGVIHREERYLESKFGAAYREYKVRVRRWI